MQEYSLFRLYLLRICYAFLAFGLGIQLYPRLLSVTATAPFNEGVVDVMLGALSLLAFIGLAAPIRMLPLLVFEVAWKVIWFAAVAVPQWLAGAITEDTLQNLFAIGLVVPYILIIPWRRFFELTLKDVERWR